jgi:hypothetical protein
MGLLTMASSCIVVGFLQGLLAGLLTAVLLDGTA